MTNKFITALKTAKAKQLGEVILKETEPKPEPKIVKKPRKKKSDDN